MTTYFTSTVLYEVSKKLFGKYIYFVQIITEVRENPIWNEVEEVKYNYLHSI